MIAIGRSSLLYNSIKVLSEHGIKFDCIITDDAYPEYKVGVEDFRDLAHEIGAKFLQTKKLDETTITGMNSDIAISVNWKYQLSEPFLACFNMGILNLHLGNLPDYKGNATVNWSILNGESHIYANIHKMVKALDAGDIIAKEKIEIADNTHIGDVLSKAEEIAPSLFLTAIQKLKENKSYLLEKGSIKGIRCYPRIETDHQIDWKSPILNIDRLIRATSKPFGGAFSFLEDQRICILDAEMIYPSSGFYASPGQIVHINKVNMTVDIAGLDGFIRIKSVNVDGKECQAAEIIRSIRKRFRFNANV